MKVRERYICGRLYTTHANDCKPVIFKPTKITEDVDGARVEYVVVESRDSRFQVNGKTRYFSRGTSFDQLAYENGNLNPESKKESKKETGPTRQNKYFTMGKFSGLSAKDVIHNKRAVIVLWDDGTKTVSKCHPLDTMNLEEGIRTCIVKKSTKASNQQLKAYVTHLMRKVNKNDSQ